jgi:hypothetical protein
LSEPPNYKVRAHGLIRHFAGCPFALFSTSQQRSHEDRPLPTNRVYNIAVIPGDGIGKEVVPEGVRVLETAERFNPHHDIQSKSPAVPAGLFDV